MARNASKARTPSKWSDAPRGTLRERKFASMGKFASTAETMACGTSLDGASVSWDYGVGFQGALELARKGWPEGAARIRAIADKLIERVQGVIENTALEYRDDGGPLLDVGRFCEGEPEHFLEFAPTTAKRPVTLSVNVGGTCVASAEQFEYRGAAVLAAAEILTARGFVVEIQGVYNTAGSKKHTDHDYTILWPIHRSGETFDADAVAFGTSHPAVQRRFGFAIGEGEPDANDWGFYSGGGYGRTRDRAEIPESWGIYQGGLWDSHSYTTEAQAAARVLEICKQAGCEIAEI